MPSSLSIQDHAEPASASEATEPSGLAGGWFVPLLLAAISIALWYPLRCGGPIQWDSVQFLLALDQYDIAKHLPHPPGYFLYVMLGRALRLVTGDGWSALLVLGGLCGAVLVAVTSRMASEIGGSFAGLLAGLMALTAPLLINDTTQGDTHSASGALSALVGWCALRLVVLRRRGPMEVIGGSVALAALAGIRPSDGVFLAPLWLVALAVSGRRPFLVGLVTAAMGTLAWVIAMGVMMGGYDGLLHTLSMIMSGFVTHRAPVTSGARWLLPNGRLVAEGLEQLLLPGAPLVLAVPFAAHQTLRRPLSWLLLLGIVPSLAVYLLLHIGKMYYLLNVAALLWLAVALSGRWAVQRLQLRPTALLTLLAPFVVLGGVTVHQTYRERQTLEQSWKGAAAMTRQLDPDSTVVLSSSVPRESRAPDGGRPWDFRHAMYYLPQFPTYMYPTDDAATVGRFNAGWHRITRYLETPIRLHGVRHVILTSHDLLRHLPPGCHVLDLRSGVLELHLVAVDPSHPVILGPGWELQCTPARP